MIVPSNCFTACFRNKQIPFRRNNVKHYKSIHFVTSHIRYMSDIGEDLFLRTNIMTSDCWGRLSCRVCCASRSCCCRDVCLITLEIIVDWMSDNIAMVSVFYFVTIIDWNWRDTSNIASSTVYTETVSHVLQYFEFLTHFCLRGPRKLPSEGQWKTQILFRHQCMLQLTSGT